MNSLQKTIFLVAGEPSGDIHGARLVSAMKKGQSNILFVGHGGDEIFWGYDGYPGIFFKKKFFSFNPLNAFRRILLGRFWGWAISR